MYDPCEGFGKHTFPNGLEVHFKREFRPWIVMEIVVHSGAREDEISSPGLAHFVEHCVNQNVPDMTHDSVKQFIESVGGRARYGNTGYLSTRYGFTVPADLPTFRKAISIFGSMILEARLEKGIETERKVIQREFNQCYPLLKNLEWAMESRGSLFNGHRLGTYNRPIGRPEGFLNATESNLQDFYDMHYTPRNMSLVILGGITIREVIAELQDSPFGKQKKGRRNSIPDMINKLAIPTVQTRTVRMSDYVKFKSDQTLYNATWAFPLNFPQQARKVFSRILDDILFEEIREKLGLAYSIDSSYQDFQNISEFTIGGMINPEATPYINDLVRKFISMVSLRRDLFDRKIESCIKQCQMVDYSGGGLCRGVASDLAEHHRIISLKEVLEGLHKVTFEQMEEAAALLSPEGQYTFIAHP